MGERFLTTASLRDSIGDLIDLTIDRFAKEEFCGRIDCEAEEQGLYLNLSCPVISL